MIAPMAEIADPWIQDPEGFWFRFVKTEGFWKGNNRILQLYKGNISFYTHFLHFFADFEKKLYQFQIILPLGFYTENQRTKFVLRYRIKNRGISESDFWIQRDLNILPSGCFHPPHRVLSCVTLFST